MESPSHKQTFPTRDLILNSLLVSICCGPQKSVIAKLLILLTSYLVANPCAAQNVSSRDLEETLLANDSTSCTVNSMIKDGQGLEIRRRMCSPHLPEQDCYYCNLDEIQRTFFFIARLLIFSARDFDKKTLHEIFKVKFHNIDLHHSVVPGQADKSSIIMVLSIAQM